MKTFVLTVSKTFPKKHKRSGEETNFIDKIRFALGGWNLSKGENGKKIHTIRSNFELWSKRIEQIQKGEAILSIRYWSGKPYNSKQIEICQLDKDSGVGIQGVTFDICDWSIAHIYTKGEIDTKLLFPSYVKLSKNDGLSVEDFKEWFKNYDLSKMMAIIHFTGIRY